MANKLDPFDIVVTNENCFPIKVFDSGFLECAVKMFQFASKVAPIITSMVQIADVKKAFTYLFWIYFGFRFQSSAFTHTGARPWHDRIVAEQVKPLD